MRTILWLIWSGLWQGFGVELSFFVLWVGWRAVHRRVAHKFDPDHIFHSIHEYFNS
jgi:hypothetical protein